MKLVKSPTLKSLRAAFAAAALTTAAVPALAQESAPATTEAAPAAPTPAQELAPAGDPAKLASYVDIAYRERVYASSCQKPEGLSACVTDETVAAIKVRELQQLFMAASYGCRQYKGFEQLPDRYNDFVLRHRDELKESYFEARNQYWKVFGEGKPGNVPHDALETGFANMYSGLSHRDGYCATASATLDAAIALEPGSRTVRDYAARVLPQGPAVIPPAAPATPETAAPAEVARASVTPPAPPAL